MVRSILRHDCRVTIVRSYVPPLGLFGLRNDSNLVVHCSGTVPHPIMPASSLIGVNDILLHIVSHVIADIDVQPTLESCFPSGGSKSNTARQTLARLARVHRRCTQPALDALWRSLPSDEALRHLLCVISMESNPPLVRGLGFGE